ncbi:MAG: hypothetical protein L6Q92_07605 [Phycisphaerae bacterium]|nr:hypothetical protein [Phycisphaerae bacterium]
MWARPDRTFALTASLEHGNVRLVLPPLRDHRRLALELRLVVWTDRDDAVQEAWLAHLEGRNTARAVNMNARRERRHRQRMVPILN